MHLQLTLLPSQLWLIFPPPPQDEEQPSQAAAAAPAATHLPSPRLPAAVVTDGASAAPLGLCVRFAATCALITARGQQQVTVQLDHTSSVLAPFTDDCPREPASPLAPLSPARRGTAAGPASHALDEILSLVPAHLHLSADAAGRSSAAFELRAPVTVSLSAAQLRLMHDGVTAIAVAAAAAAASFGPSRRDDRTVTTAATTATAGRASAASRGGQGVTVYCTVSEGISVTVYGLRHRQLPLLRVRAPALSAEAHQTAGDGARRSVRGEVTVMVDSWSRAAQAWEPPLPSPTVTYRYLPSPTVT